MSSTMILLASFAFYLAALILLIVFCLKPGNDILWLIGVGAFVFGSILANDSTISSFVALFISCILLILFGRKWNTVYGLALLFVLISGILSALLNAIWIFIVFLTIVLMLISTRISKDTEL